MLDADLIKKLFAALNEELKARGHKGEVVMCGGAVMCLVFNARPATTDIDGIFEPTKELREAAAAVAARMGVPKDWLNDGAKGFFGSDPQKQKVLELSNLRVYAPTPDYMLAMKCLSARLDGHDKDDIGTLIKHLNIRKAKEVFDIVEKYYPKHVIQPKTQFLIEELLDEQ